jgi:hypothetical protein
MFANVNIDTGFSRLEGRLERKVRLLVLAFNGMVGQAAIDVVAVNANTHESVLLWSTIGRNEGASLKDLK